MKPLLLAFAIFASSFLHASGSNTVFSIERFFVSQDLRILGPESPVVEYLQSLDRQIFIVEVSPSNWYIVAEYLLAGYNVSIEFGANDPISFRYSPSLGLITGETLYGNLVILTPESAENCPYHDGH